ncbi:acetoacetate-CoA ligase [Rhizoclosmatium globosum]|uniref:Acetoacetate-CoA ligase n=1 Tax=Rhizoclosmatium globosum TaxID=329046 RepID=A0A1Y2D1C8_9FUNG|nr:acetoacetate-CoA ligase [Rhizoclosmatium globosum]|eukprot:ORY53091.1 acetoacetate-CoA ligase [Rhizoclosmatium globosum]
MTEFREFVNTKHSLALGSYEELWQWSVTEVEKFWADVWHFTGMVSSQDYTEVLEDVPMSKIPKWFIGARLNYAENMLRFRDDRLAIITATEDGLGVQYTYAELYEQVRICTNALRKMGVKKDDVVAGYITNSAEAVIAMLATAAIGAIWSSCAPDLGPSGVIDRFGQIKPKVLFTVNAVLYNGKTYGHIEKVKAVVAGLPSLESVILINGAEFDFNISDVSNGVSYENFMATAWLSQEPLVFEQLPFSHPLFVLYSSGTTGKPKCIVHSGAGVLLQHKKEHIIHGGMTRDDVFFYYSTTSWMMWQWLVGGLSAGATIVTYDGSPFKSTATRLWDLADELKITHFGASAKYLQTVQELKQDPMNSHNLSSIKIIYSTGSPLHHEQYDFVYSNIKKDVLLGSITGGTDICSLFAGHQVEGAVHRGEIMCRCLGMSIESWDDNGKPVIGQPGDLVCTKPFPCMPVFFWDDESGEKYFNAYFANFENVWYHGDFMEVNPKTGGVVMLGRSDGTLKPSGVRFGSADLYNIMVAHFFSEVPDSLVVGQQYKNDERVIMFVKMAEGREFDADIEKRIKSKIRDELSARHVPAIILPVTDIPYTLTGKKVEIAVKKILKGETKLARTALANPNSLDLYIDLYNTKLNA